MNVVLHYVSEKRPVVSSFSNDGSVVYWDLFLC